MALQTNGFQPFIKSKLSKKGAEHTHTRIPDKKLNISAGCYNIADSDDVKQFYKKYYLLLLLCSFLCCGLAV